MTKDSAEQPFLTWQHLDDFEVGAFYVHSHDLVVEFIGTAFVPELDGETVGVFRLVGESSCLLATSWGTPTERSSQSTCRAPKTNGRSKCLTRTEAMGCRKLVGRRRGRSRYSCSAEPSRGFWGSLQHGRDTRW